MSGWGCRDECVPGLARVLASDNDVQEPHTITLLPSDREPPRPTPLGSRPSFVPSCTLPPAWSHAKPASAGAPDRRATRGAQQPTPLDHPGRKRSQHRRPAQEGPACSSTQPECHTPSLRGPATRTLHNETERQRARPHDTAPADHRPPPPLPP